MGNMDRLESIVARLPEVARVDIEAWGGEPTFRVAGKNFVFAGTDGRLITLKLTVDEAAAVVATDPGSSRGVRARSLGLGLDSSHLEAEGRPMARGGGVDPHLVHASWRPNASLVRPLIRTTRVLNAYSRGRPRGPCLPSPTRDPSRDRRYGGSGTGESRCASGCGRPCVAPAVP